MEGGPNLLVEPTCCSSANFQRGLNMPKVFLLLLLMGLASGCQEPSDSAATQQEVLPASFNIEKHPTLAYHVPGITCDLCVESVCDALAEVPGVIDVTGNSNSKKVTIAIDEAIFDAQIAKAAIEAKKGKATLASQ